MATNKDKEDKEIVKRLKSEKNQIRSQLGRFFDFISSCSSSTSKTSIQERYNRCEKLWDSFNLVQLELEYLQDSGPTDRQVFEDQYFETICKFKELLQESPQTNNNNSIQVSNVQQNFVKLPALDLPTFSGRYDTWLGFHDTFVALIDSNSALSNVQKFYYLKSCLKGDAAQIVHSIEVNDTNYEIAFKALRERYENTKFIIQSHVKCLFELPAIGKNILGDLRNMVDNIQKNLRALKSLKEPVEHWDTLLLFMFNSKLDIFSKREWETFSVKNVKNDLKDFIQFLNDRCSVLENLECHKLTANQSQFQSSNNKSGYKGPRVSLGHVSTGFINNNDNSCLYCKEGKHPLYHCSKFLNLNEIQRVAEIKKLHLCLNCFKANHISTRCSYSGCKKCGKPHNTLLHIDFSKNIINNDSMNAGEQNANKNTSNNQSENVVSKQSKALPPPSPVDSKRVSSHLCACNDTNNENPCNNIVDKRENKSAESSEIAKVIDVSSINTHCVSEGEVLLSTAKVIVLDHEGKAHEVRVLLDCGSQSNFVTSDLVCKLGLKISEVNISVMGINTSVSKSTKSVQVCVKSKHTAFTVNLNFFVLDKITSTLPMLPISAGNLKIPSNVNLADPTFNIPGKVDMLLGANIFYELLLIGQIRTAENMPIMQKTRLGWVISGTVPANVNKGRNLQSSLSQTMCNLSSNLRFDQQMELFWQLEEVQACKLLNQEEQDCEDLFVKTTKHDSDGKFIVKLPVKDRIDNLGESRTMAEKRFYRLERRFKHNDELKGEYIKFMSEYQDLGHMTEIPKEEIDIDRPVYYLPHHPVIKGDSTTTKLRVVFDGSAKTELGMSLNENLKNGPIIQDQLFSILIRFRQHNYVLGADAEKMYRQIWVDPLQRDLQRIIWRANPEEDLKHYRLNTVTYGTTSASFLAIRCLHKAAEEQEELYPRASYEVKKNFYVDDLLTGAFTAEEAKQLKDEITEILRKAGFTLRKWVSNRKDILNGGERNNIKEYIVDKDITKTLGLFWNVQEDNLQYTIRIESHLRSTKRNILSALSKIFDPLGLVGPIVVRAKILMQQLWKKGIDWDEEVSPELHRLWREFYDDIPSLNQLRIKRHALCSNYKKIEMHGFCDSSERAYGACLYLRSIHANGKITVHLLCAKSKVAPIKTVTLPRLELCGALLLSRLIRKAIEALNAKIDQINCWTDSKIVLSWLASEPGKWKTFVAHRVAEIQQNQMINKWSHVISQENPADLISRGCSTKQLIDSQLWWYGPTWLCNEKVFYENEDFYPEDDEDIPECRRVKLVMNTTVDRSIFFKFSSFIRLKRVIAYCIRFCSNSKVVKAERKTGNLTTDELENSLTIIIKVFQALDFPEEIKSLKTGKLISRASKLIALNPFLDKNEIMRVGGRINMALVSYSQKCPIILNSSSLLANLLIAYEHRKNLHMGAHGLLSVIRNKFWIIGGIRIIKKVLRKCVICFRVKPSNSNVLMGELPEQRVTPAKPFFNCGVDYAGPFNTKSSKLRQSKVLKAYLCVFVCFVTRAVHLEIVSDMTTESFLNALKRFIARRGKCKNIFSDCGTTFVGANNEMREFFKFLDGKELNNRIVDYLSQDCINWKFIPPRSPHFGGLWESCVKQAKYHLKRVVGNVVLTFEELTTVFAQIEACMNSRPLSALSSDSNDLVPLTPGHFLVGEPLIAIPEADERDINSGRLNRYRLLKQMVQHFWDRWYKECLSELNKRIKWQYPSGPSVKIGDLVVIREDNLPPLKWALGRVDQLFPGQDGIVRVVNVKTQQGIFKRAIAKLCVLPLE